MRSVAILSGSDLETACTSDVDSCKLRLRFAEGTSIDRKGKSIYTFHAWTSWTDAGELAKDRGTPLWIDARRRRNSRRFFFDLIPFSFI